MSFNPCFGGSHIVTFPLRTLTRSYLQFQSLFWWISYCDLACGLPSLFPQLCFNPCFGGSHIVTGIAYLFRNQRYSFQSLFWWISYCDSSPRTILTGDTLFQSLFWWISYCDLWTQCRLLGWNIKFQSLFWWISYCDLANLCNLLLSLRFQSLFWWISYCDKYPRIQYVPLCIVSILVLVDLIL